MILAAIEWLPIIINLLLVIFVLVSLLMTLLILMQRPKQEGLGAAFGGGVTDQVFGASTTNVLQKGTVWLGSLFFLLSLTLAVLVGQQNKQKTIVDVKKPAEEEASTEVKIPANEPKSLTAELATPPPAETVVVPAPTEVVPATPAEAPATPAGTPQPPQEKTEDKTGEP